MGGADIIPGVSGGTMALVLGIYERLIQAISRCDAQLFTHLRDMQWSKAAAHIDLRFLLTLGCGILLGVGSLARLMHYLLEHCQVETWSLLFGLITASCFVVGKMVRPWTLLRAATLLVGIGLSYLLVGLLPTTAPEGSGYVFLCGIVAISAMILPGISGAFILVIMGMYIHITGIIKQFQQGVFTIDNVLTVAIFLSGCLLGILTFSKVLRWLLARYKSVTLALLCGIMAGSLRRIWPFKHEITGQYLDQLGLPPDKLEKLHQGTEKVHQLKMKYRLFENDLPQQFNSQTMWALGLAIAGILIILVLDRIRQDYEAPPQLNKNS